MARIRERKIKMKQMIKGKAYRMQLCYIDDYELAVQGDKFHKYYTSVDGIFKKHKIMENEEIVVTKESKDTVMILGTDIELPMVILNIENVEARDEDRSWKNDEEKNIIRYVNSVTGNTKRTLIAFAVNKDTESNTNIEEEPFLLCEASEDSLEWQIKRSCDENWVSEIKEAKAKSIALEKRFAQNFKRNLLVEKKQDFTRVIKKILP